MSNAIISWTVITLHFYSSVGQSTFPGDKSLLINIGKLKIYFCFLFLVGLTSAYCYNLQHGIDRAQRVNDF